MAIVVGGGQSGFGSGGTAGIGQTLNYIGNHVYAYSGSFNPTSSGATYLDFTTAGNAYIRGSIEVNADFAGTGGSNFKIEIKIDGQTVVNERDVGNDYVPGDTEFKLIIPGGSRVEVEITGADAAANANFTGEVYF